VQENKPITVSNLKSLYLGIVNDHPKTVIEISAKQMAELKTFIGKSASYGNYKNYKTTHKYLCEFIPKFYNMKDLPLEEVNYQFLRKYELFLQTDKACKHNGAMKQMQRIKKILNWAIKNRYLKESPFVNYPISFKKYDRGYLSEEEISKIYQFKPSSKRLQFTRDFFLFQIYTGLSYADMINLTCEDIVKGIDGCLWIIKNRVKTAKKMTIPLLPIALEILARYLNRGSLGPIFKRITNQKINKNLKDLGKAVEISQRLTTHLARHSAATTIWLSNGISMEAVSEMLGHTKISTTQIYSRVVERKISEEMSKLKDKLGGQ
jgi:site-specific recombinase XerD